MDQPAPRDSPVALTVAGSDSGGGAGVQADLRTMAARGVFGTSAVTSVTAQHTRGVESTHVLPVEEVGAQIDAVRADFDLRAAKTGMLATEGIVDRATAFAADFAGDLVVDPVMVAASGDPLLEPEAEAAYEALIAEATLVTPNADEAAVLTGIEVDSPADAERAGEALVGMGADAALVKGGHVPGETVVDTLVTEGAVERFEHPRIDTDATHGSGCTLSAAIAADLARGADLQAAVADGIDRMDRAVRFHHDVGEGPGAVQGLAELRADAGRDDAVETVESILADLREIDVAPLVAEVGTNVAVAAENATDPSEVAAVEGRITRTVDGPRPNRAARMGASDHLARFLIACRAHDPELRCVINCRHDDGTRAALGELDWTVATYDRRDQPDAVRNEEGSTMAWAGDETVGDVEGTPDAVTDPGAHGKEPMCKLLARDSEELVEKVRVLRAARPEG